MTFNIKSNNDIKQSSNMYVKYNGDIREVNTAYIVNNDIFRVIHKKNGSLIQAVPNIIGSGSIPQGVYVVTPTGAGLNDGSSWSNALSFAQFVDMVETTTNTEYWFKADTYNITSTSYYHCELSEGTIIRGGYVGTDGNPAERHLFDGVYTLFSLSSSLEITSLFHTTCYECTMDNIAFTANSPDCSSHLMSVDIVNDVGINFNFNNLLLLGDFTRGRYPMQDIYISTLSSTYDGPVCNVNITNSVLYGQAFIAYPSDNLTVKMLYKNCIIYGNSVTWATIEHIYLNCTFMGSIVGVQYALCYNCVSIGLGLVYGNYTDNTVQIVNSIFPHYMVDYDSNMQPFNNLYISYNDLNALRYNYQLDPIARIVASTSAAVVDTASIPGTTVNNDPDIVIPTTDILGNIRPTTGPYYLGAVIYD